MRRRAGLSPQFSRTHTERRALSPHAIIAAERINTPRMKNTALLPKKEYTCDASIIPISGTAAIAIRLVIESGIRFVDHRLTQRKNRHKTLYASGARSSGPSIESRTKKTAKKTASNIPRRIRSRIMIGRGRRSMVIWGVGSVVFKV